MRKMKQIHPTNRNRFLMRRLLKPTLNSLLRITICLPHFRSFFSIFILHPSIINDFMLMSINIVSNNILPFARFKTSSKDVSFLTFQNLVLQLNNLCSRCMLIFILICIAFCLHIIG
uniref:Uncharacterized protein MANES_11G153300 n=1 Tax=Rhizophora mucronata TaxID=61149 RepID=A0A2P2IMU2_RHIMU